MLTLYHSTKVPPPSTPSSSHSTFSFSPPSSLPLCLSLPKKIKTDLAHPPEGLVYRDKSAASPPSSAEERVCRATQELSRVLSLIEAEEEEEKGEKEGFVDVAAEKQGKRGGPARQHRRETTRLDLGAGAAAGAGAGAGGGFAAELCARSHVASRGGVHALFARAPPPAGARGEGEEDAVAPFEWPGFLAVAASAADSAAEQEEEGETEEKAAEEEASEAAEAAEAAVAGAEAASFVAEALADAAATATNPAEAALAFYEEFAARLPREAEEAARVALSKAKVSRGWSVLERREEKKTEEAMRVLSQPRLRRKMKKKTPPLIPGRLLVRRLRRQPAEARRGPRPAGPRAAGLGRQGRPAAAGIRPGGPRRVRALGRGLRPRDVLRLGGDGAGVARRARVRAAGRPGGGGRRRHGAPAVLRPLRRRPPGPRRGVRRGAGGRARAPPPPQPRAPPPPRGAGAPAGARFVAARRRWRCRRLFRALLVRNPRGPAPQCRWRDVRRNLPRGLGGLAAIGGILRNEEKKGERQNMRFFFVFLLFLTMNTHRL